MDWFPWYPSLYRADTLDLTLEQDGAYRRLIDHYMETRLPLPDNNNSLARIIGISINDFQAIAEQVRSKFTTKAGELHLKRCDIELNRQDSISKKRSNVAKAAHKKRNKNNDVEASVEQKPCKSSNTGEERRGDSKEGKPNGQLKEAFDLFVQMAKENGLPTPRELTPTRIAKLKRRLADHNGMEDWKLALNKIKEGKFLKGENNRNWKASLGFLLQEEKYTKLLEGDYDDKNKKNGGYLF